MLAEIILSINTLKKCPHDSLTNLSVKVQSTEARYEMAVDVQVSPVGQA